MPGTWFLLLLLLSTVFSNIVFFVSFTQFYIHVVNKIQFLLVNIPKNKWGKSQQTDINKISKICEKKHSVHGLFMVVYIQVASETCFLYYEPIKSINKHLIFSKFPCNPFSCLEGYRQMNYWTNRSPSIYTFAITSCV
jgi:hypothetical protein